MDAEATPSPDRQSTSAPLASSAAVHELHLVLAGQTGSDTLRPLIRLMCAEACQRAMSPEQFLLAIKREWIAHPQLSRSVGHRRSSEVVERVISLCIEEYFHARAGSNRESTNRESRHGAID